MDKILLFVAAISVINVLFFFGSPGPTSCSVAAITPVNLLFFQFSHFDVLHLLENLLGLIFTAALAIELGMRADDFIFAYFTGIFIALPLLFAFPGTAIAGNSTGIFGALAATLLKAKRMIPVYVTYPLAVLFIFSISLTSVVADNFALSVLKTDVFHFAGFLAGAAISISTRRTKAIMGVCK
ncbi:MAG: rhomboid family intramembrane serine protease [Candidatus Aenigmatarchaeota archaeon]